MSKKSRKWHPRNMSQDAREQSRKDKQDLYDMIVGKDSGTSNAKSLIFNSTPYMQYYTVGGVNALAEAMKPKPLPTREQVDTIRTFKLANLVFDQGRIRFQGVGSHAIYDADDTAGCHPPWPGRITFTFFGDEPKSKEQHQSPDQMCTCGFYGVPDKHAKEVVNDYGAQIYVRVEAELFGRVIRHERGYRAERQRVISVSVPRRCRTFGLVKHDGLNLFAPSPQEVTCKNAPIGLRLDAGRVVPTCADHAPLGASPLTDIAAKLGVQVRWAD